jgi:hypothetical protein
MGIPREMGSLELFFPGLALEPPSSQSLPPDYRLEPLHLATDVFCLSGAGHCEWAHQPCPVRASLSRLHG